jgi:carbon monoxide dehydrogenase subunit G
MSEVRTVIDIAAPIERVWAIAIDPRRLAEWVTIHRSFGRVDDGEARTGFRMDQTLSLRGAPFKVHWTLAACEVPRRAHWHGKGPAGSSAETEYLLEPCAGGTRFAYRNTFHAPLGLIGRVAERAVAGHLPKVEAERSLRQLKRLCEES